MDCLQTTTHLKGSMRHQILLFTIMVSSFGCVLTIRSSLEPSHFAAARSQAAPPSSELFEPIEIPPAVIPNVSNPGPLSPMYPSFPSTFPNTYEPVLTGRCPVNFSALSSVLDRTASDCFQYFAEVVGDVVCCPQFGSLLHIFQGYYSTHSDKLVLESAMANDCFTDIINILTSRRANKTISTVCSIKSSDLTGGACPMKDVATFEKTVNTSKLLEACGAVDPLRECCRPVCQPALMEAAFRISGEQFKANDNQDKTSPPNNIDALNDCKGVVYSWLSWKLPLDAANTAFRILSACKVNKVCPLDFKQPTEVIKACHNIASPSPTCCSSLNTYIAGIEKQKLITNKQAIVCATTLGSMLQKGGVMTNLYELCDVDLKDFSLQAYGQQGCLLRSLPADMAFDNATGLTFTCDLIDNIAAPWPSSSLASSLTFCAPEMSLPALPTSAMLGNHGFRCTAALEFLVSILSFLIFSTISY